MEEIKYPEGLLLMTITGDFYMRDTERRFVICLKKKKKKGYWQNSPLITKANCLFLRKIVHLSDIWNMSYQSFLNSANILAFLTVFLTT